MIMAAWHKIPIRSLDQYVPEMQKLLLDTEMEIKRKGAEAVGNRYAAYRGAEQKGFFKRILAHYVVRTYQKGDLNEIAKLRQLTRQGQNAVKQAKREQKWCEILIPKLLEADKPIGIAVGVNHIVGKDSLSERFAQAGLKVELITPKPSNGYINHAVRAVNAWRKGKPTPSQPTSRL